eukprot:TRINITY_DN21323_c0_g1_i1.p1 TRINITY_DN21323_c0_g1~~TRINITY_DN21323_c0_g1_i1.p1  ORF type:complete len:132 (+),score=12.79 TRINITY_DN21323_c0_g1_i1:231-626(+)
MILIGRKVEEATVKVKGHSFVYGSTLFAVQIMKDAVFCLQDTYTAKTHAHKSKPQPLVQMELDRLEVGQLLTITHFYPSMINQIVRTTSLFLSLAERPNLGCVRLEYLHVFFFSFSTCEELIFASPPFTVL